MNIDELAEQDLQEAKGQTAQFVNKLEEKLDEVTTIDRKIASLSNSIKELELRKRRITEEEVPDIMIETGASSITLQDGRIVSLHHEVHCGIAEKDKQEAFAWLRSNNHGDLIKNEMTVKFSRNEGNMVGDVRAKVEELGLKYNTKEKVEAQTLKAFIKEQIRQKANLPTELFGIYQRKVVKIK